MSTSALVQPPHSIVSSTLHKLRSHRREVHNDERRFATTADAYFQEHNHIPRPKIMHAQFENLMKLDSRTVGYGTNINDNTRGGDETKGVLVIGDVHGCLDELKHLVQTSVTEHNNGVPFDSVVLVGDLCNKGPKSAEVIRFVRRQKHWFTVRGNHDNGALAAALGDERRGKERTYSWIKNNSNGDNGRETLTDEDIEWLASLPYTITIPARYFDGVKLAQGLEEDVIVVHAGLVPDVQLQLQEIQTMTTIRELKGEENSQRGRNENSNQVSTEPWGKVWSGPQHVIFGHDAKRRLQIHDHATGLDTGACYGGQLTGIILPGKTLVSVDAEKIHCPIKT